MGNKVGRERSAARIIPRGEGRTILPALFLIVAVAINLAGLTRYPYPHTDEVIFSNISYNFIRHGRFALDIMGSLAGLERNHLTIGRLYHMGQGALFAVLGVSLFTVRLYSFIGFVVAAGFVYLAGRKLYGERVGLLSVAAFVASMNVFWASHWARPEMWVVAVSVGLLYYYLVVREEDFGRWLSEWGAEYVIADDTLGGFYAPEIADVYTLYLESACARVGEVQDRWFGPLGETGQGEPSAIYDCTQADW